MLPPVRRSRLGCVGLFVMVVDLDSEFFNLLGVWSGSERGLAAQGLVQMFRLTVVGEVSTKA